MGKPRVMMLHRYIRKGGSGMITTLGNLRLVWRVNIANGIPSAMEAFGTGAPFTGKTF